MNEWWGTSSPFHNAGLPTSVHLRDRDIAQEKTYFFFHLFILIVFVLSSEAVVGGPQVSVMESVMAK